MASLTDEQMTMEELRSFYRIDREIYRLLAITLGKDPLTSMAVIALWVFMEDVIGYPNIIFQLLTYEGDLIINSAFEEAVWSLHYIITGTPPPPFRSISITDMPTTLKVIREYGSTMYISMNSLFQHGESGYIFIKQTVGNVCYRMFEDIFREAMLIRNPFDDNLNGLCNDCGDEIHEETNIPEVKSDISAPITGKFVEPEPITSLKVEEGSSSGTAQGENISEIGKPLSILPKFEELQIVQVIPPCERTMFVTFSRGFPISEDQIREFFGRTYGENCIESIYMQEIMPPQRRQSMYAKIVFDTTETIDNILAGEEKVRFFINGRHIQARRFEVRQGSR
ncbi:hypothetical protein MKX01_012906 [Papaver californicum]|nr:hypothetical protein MKX01_012906 [Papaver californicum]